MNSNQRSGFFQELNRVIPAWTVLAAFVLYTLGAGISVYQGQPISIGPYLAGQALVITLLTAAFLLNEYFQTYDRPANEPGSVYFSRGALLLVTATLLTIGALLTVVLFTRNNLAPAGYVFTGLGLAISLSYSTPPLALARKGYGEILLTILLTAVSPGLGLLLQNGEYHRLLAQLTFPLALLCLAAQVAMRFPTYAADTRAGQENLVIRLGWQRALLLHNLLLLAAFLLFGFASLNGLPWSLTWPALLGFPIALAQLWLMNGIGQGRKPAWSLLLVLALTSFLLTAYFITLALMTA